MLSVRSGAITAVRPAVKEVLHRKHTTVVGSRH
jgi:hypothetical protein